jgi:hypothetical protein
MIHNFRACSVFLAIDELATVACDYDLESLKKLEVIGMMLNRHNRNPAYS